MKVIEKIKNWNHCIKVKKEEYKKYQYIVELAKKDIVRYQGYLNDANKKLKSIIDRGFSNESEEYIQAKEDVQKWSYVLNESMLSLSFIRPNSSDDIEYRKCQADNFASRLEMVLSDDLDLRFHGTPIFYAKEIIKTGSISSSADRYDGYIKSTDLKGEISVSNKKTVDRTINYFCDMFSFNRNLPCGCIFALYPKDKNDSLLGEKAIMHSVDFKSNPNQLYGIFTTPENKEIVKNWMQENGLNPEIVYDFEEFLKVVEIDSKKIEEKTKFDKKIRVDIKNNNVHSNETHDINKYNENSIKQHEQDDESVFKN